jgi:hypothetical protein
MISGDNRLAAAHVAASVGIDPSGLLTGAEIDRLDDHQLTLAARDTHVFAEVDPVHKERIIQALRTGGTVVGYLGDGINDAGALHLADVGISVDTAVDVAKSAAAIVLLDKDLGVLAEGVRLGGQAPVLPGRRPARPPSTKRAPPPAAGPRRRRAQRPLAATMKLQGERVVPWRPIANPSSRPGGLPDRRDGQRFGGACGRGRSALPARAGGTHAQGGGWVRDERGRPMASASRGGMATAKEFGMPGSAIAFDQVGSVGPILAEAASSR